MKNQVALPSPQLDGSVSLEAAIAARRSVRAYAPSELQPTEIGQLLWSAQGITGNRPNRRAAPSAGAFHPLEFYVCLDDGVWHYEPTTHSLSAHLEQDVRERLAAVAWNQKFIGEAPAVFLVSGVAERTTQRYGDRGLVRYLPMEAGHASENLLLQAVALGLVGVVVGAFDDTGVAETVNLPSNQTPLYIIPIGRPA